MAGWKKWYILIAAFFIITAIAGKVILAQAPDAGLAGISQLDEVYPLSVELEYALGDNESESSIVKSFTENQAGYISEIEAADIIVRAEATGRVHFTTGTYGQEIRVSSVIKGSEWVEKDEKCWVWRNYGMEVIGGRIVYRNTLNMMQKGSYLVFLKSNKLNQYRSEKEFQTASEYFGYLSTSGKKASPMDESKRNVPYREWEDITLFTSSEKIADAWNEIAQLLIKKYAS